MSNSNILNPLVNAGIAYLKWFKSAWTLNKNIDFLSLFKNMNLKNKDEVYPRLVKQFEEEFYRMFEFNIPIGMSIEDFKKKKDVFAQILNVDEKDLVFKRKDFNVIIKARNSKVPNFEYDEEIHKAVGFKIPIGMNLETLKLRYWDLSDPANAHMYVAGSTRSGKSNLIRLIIAILTKKSCADIQFSLLNVKKVDLLEFKDIKNTVHYTEEVGNCVDILDDNIDEMYRRYKLFSKYSGVKNIWSYRDKVQKLPVRLIIIEEIGIFEKDDDFHNSLRIISQQGAAAGIFLILATQLPNMHTLKNTTKQNICTVVGGKCRDSIRSEIIAENSDLHKLRGKGHMKVFDSDDYGTEIQSFYIKDEVVETITNRNLKKLKNK